MILFVLDHLKTDMYSETKRDSEGKPEFDFFRTTVGRSLSKMVGALGLTGETFKMDFGYRAVPEVIGNKKYKPITKTMGKPYYLRLRKDIVKNKPDLIVTMGNIATEAVINKRGINSLRGLPRKEDFSYTDEEGVKHTHSCWVLPTFSIENVLVDKNKEGLLDADFTVIKKFVDQGEAAFEAKPVGYELVTNFDRVKEIFTEIIPKQKLTAWDLETNTLKAELSGYTYVTKDGVKHKVEVKPKVLVISLSWKEGQGCTIPLEHRQAQRAKLWTEGQLSRIFMMIKRFVRDQKIPKVGHNIRFDCRYLALTHGFTEFNKCMDTKVFHYLAVSQDPKAPRDLSTLAYQYTSMGGYDHPLEEYKKRFLQTHKRLYKINQSIERKEYKEQGKKYLVKEHPYNPPANSIDGGNFDYDWIPLSVLYPYASGDVDCCLRIANKLLAVLKKDKQLYSLATSHYPELIDALAWVEANGMPLDKSRAKVLNKKYEEEKERLRNLIRETIPEVKELEESKNNKLQAYLREKAKPPKERDKEIMKKYKKYYDKGTEYNPSPNAPDNGEVLYRIMGYTLPFDKEHIKEKAFEEKNERTVTWEDYKADTKGALPYLIDTYDCEMAKLLMQYSKVATLWQNFTNKLPKMVGKGGLVHGSFNETGTETSRLAAKNPNFQNLGSATHDPKRFDYYYPIKSMFHTQFDGGALLNVDYSSLEVKIAGLFAKDEDMTKSFFEGKDTHKNTASLVYNVPEEEVTPDQRKLSKKVTFGILYGETPLTYEGLSRAIY